MCRVTLGRGPTQKIFPQEDGLLSLQGPGPRAPICSTHQALANSVLEGKVA